MADWTTPKTTWVATDFYNASDYNRMVGNLIYLKQQATKVFGTIAYETMVETKDYKSMIYAREFNAIENNLDKLNTSTYSFDIGAKKTYYANQSTPDYKEFNRIESAFNTIKAQLDVHTALFHHLKFTLGGAKTLGVRAQ